MSTGVVIDFAIIVAFAKNKNIIRHSDVWILLAIINEFISLIVFIAFLSITIANNGFAWGITGCQVFSSSLISFSLISVSTLFVLSLDRYRVIVSRKESLAFKYPLKIPIFIILFNFLVGFLPMYSGFAGQYFGLSPSKLICLGIFKDHSLLGLFQSILILTISAIITNSIGFFYYKIYQKIKTIRRDLHVPSSDTSSVRTDPKKRDQLEERVLIQSIFVVGWVFLGWTLTFFGAVYQLISGNSNSVEYDIVAFFLSGTSVSLNGLVILFFDKRLRVIIIGWFKE